MKTFLNILLITVITSASTVIVKKEMIKGVPWESVTYSLLLGGILPIMVYWGAISYRGFHLTLDLPAVGAGVLWGISLFLYNRFLANHEFIYTAFLNRAFLSVFTVLLGIVVLGEHPSGKQIGGLILIFFGMFLL